MKARHFFALMLLFFISSLWLRTHKRYSFLRFVFRRVCIVYSESNYASIHAAGPRRPRAVCAPRRSEPWPPNCDISAESKFAIPLRRPRSLRCYASYIALYSFFATARKKKNMPRAYALCVAYVCTHFGALLPLALCVSAGRVRGEARRLARLC